jgi:hypothetical protein
LPVGVSQGICPACLLCTAERQQAVAQARAVEEQRRRKLQLVLAVYLMVLITIGGLSATFYIQQKHARAALAAGTLGEAATLHGQALAHADDPARWQAALAAVRRAEEALGEGSGDSRRQLSVLRAEVQTGLDAAQRDAAEVGTFVQLWTDQGRYAAAARLLGNALAADPELGDDRRNLHRYHAACYAALAGCGKSTDDPGLDERARTALRRQALDWLKAERDAWAQYLEAGTRQDRAAVIKNLKQWQQDADLAGVRGDEALAKLPDEEQKAWRGLWSDVEGLLNKAEADGP